MVFHIKLVFYIDIEVSYRCTKAKFENQVILIYLVSLTVQVRFKICINRKSCSCEIFSE